MNKGQRVKIYQRPITSELFEGEAVITEILGRHPFTAGMNCMVKFDHDEDGEEYQRIVMDKDIIP